MISVTAIPLSLIAAIVVLYWRGQTVNTMVLAGLVIALGEVVDDAIIDVENIIRRLRLNRQSPAAAKCVSSRARRLAGSAQRGGLRHVHRRAGVSAGVLSWKGLAGSFFRPLAMAYVLAIVASLGVALIVTPALSLMLLPQAVAAEHRDSPVVTMCKRVYRRLLPPLVRRPWATLGARPLCAVAFLLLIPLLGEELMPKFKETDFLDALGREAGHRHRCHEPHHDAGQRRNDGRRRAS